MGQFGVVSKNLSFILHKPQLAENVGAVARAMGNFGLTTLRIVDPQCDILDPKAVAMSAGATAILEQAATYDTLLDAMADLHWVYGTCAVQRHLIKEYIPVRQAAQQIHQQSLNSMTGVIFGPERTGLSNDILAICHGIIQIPVAQDFSSMNLAQASVIMAYELSGYADQAERTLHYGETRPACQQQLQAFLVALESHLDRINYWRVPAKKALMKQNLENVFTRMQPTEQDIRSLWGIVDMLAKSHPKS